MQDRDTEILAERYEFLDQADSEVNQSIAETFYDGDGWNVTPFEEDLSILGAYGIEGIIDHMAYEIRNNIRSKTLEELFETLDDIQAIIDHAHSVLDDLKRK